jgi:hypothetical protein
MAGEQDFVAADEFGGTREGYVFGTGASGTGYYREAAAAARAERASKLQAPVPAPAPTPEREVGEEGEAGGSGSKGGWVAPEDQQFDLESVPALSAEAIKEAEDAEALRVGRHVGLVRSLPEEEVVATIFRKFDGDGDGKLNMSEYGTFLKAISYSKAWTEAQWAKECGMVGTTADEGVRIEHMSTLYTRYRARKLRIDYANVFRLPGEEVRKVIDEERRKHGGGGGGGSATQPLGGGGGGGGGTDAAASIGMESQMLAASDRADSKLSPEEYKMMQGMLGGSKAKGTKVLAKLSGVTQVLTDGSFDANQTLVLMGCRDCVVDVQTTCVKVFVNSCENVRLTLSAKVITHTLEVYKCRGCDFAIGTKVWTAQVDLCHACTLQFADREQFQTIISAGCHELAVHVGGGGGGGANNSKGAAHQARIHFPALAAAAAEGGEEINEERTQFKTHFKGGKLATEQVIRLDNGFPATVDEKAEFDRKQEFNMKKLAENSGFNIARKKDVVKLKPNAPCVCGSGKKQKKCCGLVAK